MDGETLKAEAIQLIESHIDLSEAFAELLTVDEDRRRLERGDQCWTDIVQLAERLDASQPSLLATQELMTKLVGGEVCGESAVKMVDCLERNGLLDHRLFAASLVKSLHRVPLDIICQLFISNHVSVSYIFSQTSETSCIEIFSKIFSSEKISQSILPDFSRLLLSEVYSPPRTLTSSPTGFTVTSIANFLQRQFSSECWSESSYTLLDALALSTSLPFSILKQLYCDLLVHFVVLSEPTLEYNEVISCQEEWQFSKLPPNRSALFCKLVKFVGHSDISQCIDRAVAYSSAEVNWDPLLTMAVCYITSSQEAANCFKEYIVNLLAQATTSHDEDMFSSCLIFARQAALEGAHIHPPYHKWFQGRFGHLQHSSKKVLHFIIRKLTDLVPFEPAYCLKAHMHGLPRLSSAQNAVSEYIALAKTRLSELEDYSEPVDIDVKNADDSALEDVRECIEAFNSSGVIPTRVLQASLFQKPYYINVFLRTLLSPTLPEKMNASQLIQALSKEKKIPKKMLNEYNSRPLQVEGCSQSTSASPKLQNVDTWFQKMIDTLNEGEFPEKGQRLLSKLSSTLSSCSDRRASSVDRELDWLAPNVCQHYIEVSDMIVSHLCRIVCLECTDYHSAIQSTLLMLTNHLTLHKPILFRLWELLHCQLSDLTRPQLSAIANLCCHLWLSEHSLPSLHLYNSKLMLSTWSECCESLLKELTHATAAQINSTAQFCSEFLDCCLKHSESPRAKLAPPVIVTKFRYLCKRGEVMKDMCSRVASQLSSYPQWEELEVEFVDWLNWELDISEDPLKDCERENYVLTVFSEYLGGGLDVETAFCHVYASLTLGRDSPGFSSLVPVLQEICISLPSASSPPSLIKAMQSMPQQTTKGPHGMNVVQSPLLHIRVLGHIPTHLLLTNTLPPDIGLLPDALHALANLLKTQIVHSGNVLLEPTFTSYICKSVQCVERLTGDDSLCQKLIDRSPIFHASLICYWNQLKHFFVSRELPSVIPLFDWLDCIRECEDSPLPLPPQTIPYAVLAACLVKLHVSLTQTDWKIILTVLPEQAVFILVDFSVRLMTFHVNYFLLDLIKACVSKCPFSLTVFSVDNTFIAEHKTCIESSRDLFPIQSVGSDLNYKQWTSLLLFKLLQTDQVLIDHLVQCSFVDDLLPVVVLAHSHLLDLASSISGYQAVDVDLIEKSTTITKQFLQVASNTALESCCHFLHSTLKPYDRQ